MPQFEETAPTFAENAARQSAALFQLWAEQLASRSMHSSSPTIPGLVVARARRRARREFGALRRPERTAAERNAKLLHELSGKTGADRDSAIRLRDRAGRPQRPDAIVSARADGIDSRCTERHRRLRLRSRFLFSELKKTFAELSREEKNHHSHRGKAFRRLLTLVPQLTYRVPHLEC